MIEEGVLLRGSRMAHRVHWTARMSNAKPTRKLELKKVTIRELTSELLGGVHGGITGVTDGASNQTGFDTKGVKLSAQWYLQKWTISK